MALKRIKGKNWEKRVSLKKSGKFRIFFTNIHHKQGYIGYYTAGFIFCVYSQLNIRNVFKKYLEQEEKETCSLISVVSWEIYL